MNPVTARTEGGKSTDLHDRGHESRHGDRGTGVDIGDPEVERSGTRLEQEAENHEQNAHAVNGATAFENRRKERGRTRRTVNHGDTVQEEGAKDGARDKVLEHAFARIFLMAADTHKGIHREASEFHAQEERKEVDGLRHEKRTASGKEHEPVGFATLELLVTERPLQSGNTEERAEQHGNAEQATNRIHREQVENRIRIDKREGGHSSDNEQRSDPRENLVLVLVPDERFGSERHEGAKGNNRNRQEVNEISHWKPPCSELHHLFSHHPRLPHRDPPAPCFRAQAQLRRQRPA